MNKNQQKSTNYLLINSKNITQYEGEKQTSSNN